MPLCPGDGCLLALPVRVETESTMTADATTFDVTNAVDACEGETRVATRRWVHKIPRDHN